MINFPFKKQAIEIGVVLVLLVVSFAFGRFFAPTKIKTVTVTQTQTVVQWKDRVVTQVVYRTKIVKVKDTALSVDKTTTTTKKPDGTTTTTTTTHEQLATQTTASQSSSDSSNTVSTKNGDEVKQTQTVVSKEIDNSKPSWMINVGYGYNSHVFDNLTNLQKPMLEGTIQRRIIGPIYMGAFGGYDFQSTTANFGLTLGLSL